MNQLLVFGLMRSDGNTLEWKLITSSLTFLIEVVKSLLSALAITVYFCTKTQDPGSLHTKTCSSNSNFPTVFYFYFICHTIITKNIGKEEKKKWRGDLTETIGAYERLGLLEL